MTTVDRIPYTAAEDAILRERVNSVSISKIARLLERSRDSVKNRAATLGLSNRGLGESAIAERATRAADRQFEREFINWAGRAHVIVHQYRKSG